MPSITATATWCSTCTAVPSIDSQAPGLSWAALRGVRRRGGKLAVAGARTPLHPALKALSSGGLQLYETVGAAESASHKGDARS